MLGLDSAVNRAVSVNALKVLAIIMVVFLHSGNGLL